MEAEEIVAQGQGRGRRYSGPVQVQTDLAGHEDGGLFPAFIPMSADSRDIASYINQPLEARITVGYQQDFLDAYEPNNTCYLP